MGVASKTGWVYLLNRITGKPILGIPEKKVPQLKGAAAKYANISKTQPYPVGEPFTTQCSTAKSGRVRRRTASRSSSAASSRRTPT